MTEGDPVFKEEGMWYFYDETWSNVHGPFETEDDARKAVIAYVNYLNHGVL